MNFGGIGPLRCSNVKRLQLTSLWHALTHVFKLVDVEAVVEVDDSLHEKCVNVCVYVLSSKTGTFIAMLKLALSDSA